MNNRVLTTDEIADLFSFCRLNGVKQYEIQVELVDHLAASIEALWRQEQDVSFLDALIKVYHDFGRKNFQAVAKAKRRMYCRRYRIMLLRFVLSFFKLPQVIVTIALTMLLFMLLSNHGDIFTSFSYTLLPTIAIGLWYRFFYYPKTISWADTKPFLMIEYSDKLVKLAYSVLTWFQIGMITVLNFHLAFKSVWVYAAASFLIVLFFIVEIALLIYLPRRLKEDFAREYPQMLIY